MTKIYSYPYQQSYIPSMPVVEVTIKAMKGQVTLPAIVDSGADATMIPLPILQQIGGRYVSPARLRGITGDSQLIKLYLVNIEVGGEVIHAIEAIATSDDELILGRDVLNQLVVTLHGTAEIVEILGRD